jgi:hypothetical protein
MSDEDGTKPKREAKGIEIARRDNCPWVVDVMSSFVDGIVIDGDTGAAEGVISSALRELLGGRVEIGRLVVTKAISKSEYKSTVVHVEVAKRMRARDPTYACSPGERIPYVITCNGSKKLFEKAEDPLWAINNSIPLDYDYYISNQLAGPVARVAMWMFGLSEDKVAVRAAEAALRAEDHDEARAPVLKKALVKAIERMQANVEKRFFGPGALVVHPRKVQSTSSNRGCIDSFFAKKAKAVAVVRQCKDCGAPGSPTGACEYCATRTCRGCRRAIERDLAHGPCRECSASIAKRELGRAAMRVADVEDLAALAAEAKAKCDKCRGYEADEIKCVQKDCPNLYRRAVLAVRMKEKTGAAV